MNGIQNISDKILSEVHEKAAAITAEAKQSAQAIKAEAAERAEREAKATLASSKARVLDIEEKARLSAELERKKLIAGEKQMLISQAFDKALKALIDLPGEQYRALLVSLAAKAVADGEGGELLLNARDRAAHGEAVLAALNSHRGSKALTLAPDSANIPGGVVIRRGRIELNCALDVIVRMLSEEAAFEVSGALFGKGA